MDFTTDERERYARALDKIMRAAQGSVGFVRDIINATLDDLISIDYTRAHFIKAENLNPVLCRTSGLIPLEDDLLVTKFSQWLASVTNCKNVKFSVVAIDTLCRFLLEAYYQSPEWAQPEILRALGAVLYENGPSCPQILDELVSSSQGRVGLLFRLLKSENSEVKRTSMQCIGNLCMRSESGSVIEEVHLQHSYQQVLTVLHEGQQQTDDDVTYLRLLLASLKSLQNILGASKSIHTGDLGKVLAALKSVMLVGLPGIGFCPPIQPSLLPSPFFLQERSPSSKAMSEREVSDVKSTPSSGASKKKKKPKRARQQEQSKGEDDESQTAALGGSLGLDESDVFNQSWPITGKITSSESEYSDTEGGQTSKLRSLSGKVRHASLGCLHSVFKNTEKRVLFGYWSFFVPDAPVGTSGPPPQTLFTSILKENNAKCRAGSVMVLSTLLEGSKQFLVAAEDREYNRASFTPFSQTLASMIKEIHRCLQLSLAAETYGSNITQIIKCMSILVGNVPYQQLSSGLLTKVVRSMRPFYQHKDNRVRTACLTCLGAVVSASAPLNEVHQLLAEHSLPKGCGSGTLFARLATDKEDRELQDQTEELAPTLRGSQEGPSDSREEKSVEGDQMSWLIRWCSDIITGGEDDHGDPQSISEVLPVRLEALQVLTQIIKHYFDLVQPFLTQLTVIIQVCLKSDDDDQVRLHGLKVLEELGKSMLANLTADKETGTRLTVQQVVTVWDGVLGGPLPSVLQDTAHLVLQASACDCLGTIGPQTMDLLPVHHRILIMTVLLGLVNEEDYRLQMASIRALGVIVQYPCLREDVTFVADTANAILGCMQHSSVNVRMRAAWSLGNLCDALHSNIQNDDSHFLQAFSELLLQRLLEAAISGSSDHDKVKSNSVRALGLLGRILESQTLKKNVFQSLIKKAMETLLRNINTGAMKVRWNSCYALGNFFRNPHLPADGEAWQGEIFSSLTKLLTSCKNFKVRINAALSLSLIEARSGYGSQIHHIWMSLLRALELIDDVEEVSELKYRDTLRQQLCHTLIHIFGLLTPEDSHQIFKDTVHLGKEWIFITNVQLYVKTLQKQSEDNVRSTDPDRLPDTAQAMEKLKRASDNAKRLLQEHSQPKEKTIMSDLSAAMQGLSVT
ncbi:HEAT repeat-containing protein 6 [Holothuria leucospilota]|uniref:HEAT repeat-containing protein 6 n=1 Tax=Holothuria leucospilota TaxID=206669 RepID=A0A9Q1HBZ7_HOLLE|nr:HEAT repeat-containing protein 6 [Holothuria leucospilota]